MATKTITNMVDKKLSYTVAVILLILTLSILPAHGEPNATVESVVSGDYIKLEDQNSVYYINENLERQFVFHEWMYKTWKDDFSNVKTLKGGTDLDDYFPFATPPAIGPRPGSVVITSPETNAVFAIGCDNILHKFEDTNVLTSLYGTDFDFYDIPGYMLSLFTKGEVLDGGSPHCGQIVKFDNDEKIYIVEDDGYYHPISGVLPNVIKSNQIKKLTETLKSSRPLSDVSVSNVSVLGTPGGNQSNQSGSAKSKSRLIFYGGRSSNTGSAPEAISTLSATASSTEVILTWSEPTNSGSAITGYTVQYRVNGSSSFTTFSVVTGLTATVTGLTNGTAYDFNVISTNSSGNSSDSNSVSATPSTEASAPSNLTVTSTGDSFVTLSWDTPSSNGGSSITDYQIEYRASGGSFAVFADSVSTANTSSVTGLTNGTEYGFRVAAVTGFGTSSLYSGIASSTPSSTPSQITTLSASASSTEIVLSWSAPNDGGNTITSYKVEQRATGGSFSLVASPTNTSYTASSLTNGTEYGFRVSAVNGVGYSPSSTIVSSTPASVPGSVTSLSVATTTSEGVLNLAWSAPVSNGGSSITDYQIEYKTTPTGTFQIYNDSISTTNTTTVTVSTSQSFYFDFQVSAVNAMGTGTASTAVTNTLVIALASHSITGGGCSNSDVVNLRYEATNYATQNRAVDMDSTYYTGGNARRFYVNFPANLTTSGKRPIVFAWQGGANTALTTVLQSDNLQSLSSTTTGPGPAIVIAPEEINYASTLETHTSPLTWTTFDSNINSTGTVSISNLLNVSPTSTGNPDLIFFDDILRCLYDAFPNNIDFDRIYSWGESGGGYLTANLAIYRSNRISAWGTLSSGMPFNNRTDGVNYFSYYPLKYSTPESVRPGIVKYGKFNSTLGNGDVLSYQSAYGSYYHFASSSAVLADFFRNDGSLIVECQHDRGHGSGTLTNPNKLPSLFWPFFSAHPRYVTSSPSFTSTSSYPADFNPYDGVSVAEKFNCQSSAITSWYTTDKNTTVTIPRPWPNPPL